MPGTVSPRGAVGYSPRVPPNSHCADCGAPYASAVDWPRTCTSCGATAYRNPLPVAVALQPVHDADGTGLVVITRTVQPEAGKVALPGGFVDFQETWQEAAVRELREETRIEAEASTVRLADALSSSSGHLLVFALLPTLAADVLPPSAPTAETTGWHLLRAPDELAFPLHTAAVANWFAGRYA
ncbi:NUDIX domain-containing protein [Streptomyces sp. NPDC047315]|uniref:NUDIX domain-containing protein n=1 Tax=Streptomyces sp. NPDC047315 TaxID=3155142 RepID=UPI0033E0A78C